MNFEPVIGIEIHVELNTKSKMFSAAPVTFGKMPNSQTVQYDLSCPGTMPQVNKEAVRDGIKIATALHMSIDKLVKFDRKNYFYPDLPKGYQITQQFHPIGSEGYLDLDIDGKMVRIGVERAHLEEDTAKQLHLGDMSLVDYNRAGTPLVEIVSKPDMRSGLEAMKYVEEIREIVTFLDVSDGKMENGSMRCDGNVSIRPVGSEKFGTKCEIKNLNSIANVRAAIDYEVKRQSELILSGQEVRQETRRYDETNKCTVLMRVKNNAVDYKYFRDPNIVPIQLSDEFVKETQASMNKLPWVYKQELLDKGLSKYETELLIANKAFVYYFNDCVDLGVKSLKTLWNYLLGDISAHLNKEMLTLEDLKFSKQDLVNLCDLVSDNKINSKQAKKVMELMINDGADPLKVVKSLGLEQVSDPNAILAIVKDVLSKNEQSVTDYKNGKDKALGYIVGQVMKASRGKANPGMAKELVLKEIGE